MSPDEQLSFLTLLKAELQMQISEFNRSLELIDERMSLLAQKSALINVPWVGQNTSATTDDYTKSDCGAACIAMIVNWFGGRVTVDDVSGKTGKPPGYQSLNISDMIATAQKFHLSFEYAPMLTADQFHAELNKGRPVVALLNYQSIPAALRYDMKYSAGHWIVVVGYHDDGMIYHDPYWPDKRGGAIRISDADFSKAFETRAPGNTNAQHALVLR